jgi:aminomethyltransferase
MKHTPLYQEHLKLGARMVSFGEWEMPERYTSIIEEHRATRTAAGLFDLSHMGEFLVSGAAAADLVQYLVTNDVATLPVDGALYAPMCQDDGGIVDDIIVYRPGYLSAHYLLVVNASNIAKDLAWVRDTARGLGIERDVDIDDRSQHMALIALQGRRAMDILDPLMVDSLRDLKPFHMLAGDVTDGVEAMVSRTGYTGEDGFELYVNEQAASSLWNLLLKRGRDHGLLPVGLGARDTLRLEARLPLYGNDIDETTTPLEAGLGRFVKLDDGDFQGRDALRRQKEEGLKKRLVGLEMEDRAIPRPHYPVTREGREVGHVTSGTFSPTLNKGIALAYVEAGLAPVGTNVEIQVRDQPHPARVVKTPFYHRSKADVGGN